MMTVSLKCYPGELKTGEVYYVHVIRMRFWLYVSHARNILHLSSVRLDNTSNSLSSLIDMSGFWP